MYKIFDSGRFVDICRGPGGLRRWLVQDKKSEKYYDLSPYVYCAGDPVNLVDPDGNWNVKVQANEDRSISSYAIFSVYSDDNLLLFRTVVRVQGSSRDRGTKNADTPTGTYRILGWRETGPGTSYDAISYGVNDLLALDYIEGEAAENRNGIHVHGGRDQSTELKPTLGCIRMNDHDLWEFKLLMALLEQIDPKEKGGTLFVENTIDYPIYYEEREIYNQSVVTGDITPAIIYSETPTNVTPEKEDKQ